MTAIGIWSPPTERSRFIAITFSGTGMGIFVIYPFVGLIISAIGWEAAFYAVGEINCYSEAKQKFNLVIFQFNSNVTREKFSSKLSF